MTTITRQDWEVLQRIAGRMGGRFVLNDGITITDPDPPEGMVKLAREIAEQAMKRRLYSADASGYRCAGAEAALAALQYADRVVREADDWSANGTLIERNEIRRKLGAIA